MDAGGYWVALCARMTLATAHHQVASKRFIGAPQKQHTGVLCAAQTSYLNSALMPSGGLPWKLNL